MPLDSIAKIYALISSAGEIKLANREFDPKIEFPADSIPYYESCLDSLYSLSEKLYDSDFLMGLSD
jgi:hypothetical protein